MRLIRPVLLFSLLTFSFSSFSWTPDGASLSIKGIVEWQDNQKVVVWLSNDEKCFIPSTEKNLISFVYMIYMNKKNASWHCHDATENIGGFSAHRLHRVVLLN